ncbi:unnamed protein product [Symbiodinium pilosum]|uniref:Methyltransferase domain-containing protein n=1 Tax=Symbiodinium pilosum TaxID=2952 RepID=A0A812M735_SYMPI|nr:unnamed protein product [Symbiodinium pilosum]
MSAGSRPPLAMRDSDAGRGAQSAFAATASASFGRSKRPTSMRSTWAQTAAGPHPATPTPLRRPSSTPAHRPTQRPMTRSMEKQPLQYWNQQAKNYDDNIFSTIDEDRTGIISETIEGCARSLEGKEGPGRCVDLGCGAGKYLHKLAKHFHQVVAYDLSPKLVALAQKEVKNRHISNVHVSVRDLAQVWYRLEPASQFGHLKEMESYSFAVLANVLIAPGDPSLHQRMLLNAYRSVCPGGRVLCIVPAWESAMYVNMRCDEEKYEGPYTVGVGGSKPTRTEGADLLRGILRRSGVRTKHYLEPEFRHMAGKVGLQVEMCKRVEYSWRSELGLSSECQVPPRLKDSPLPWDWLFLLQRPVGEENGRPRPGPNPALAQSDSETRLPTLFQPKALVSRGGDSSQELSAASPNFDC